MMDRNRTSSKGTRDPKKSVSELGLSLNYGIDPEGRILGPVKNTEYSELRIEPRRPKLPAPVGTKESASPATLQAGMYYLNVPILDDYFYRGIAMKVKQEILAWNKQYQISFFDQYPEALLGGTAPTSLFDIDTQVERMITYYRDYITASMFLTASIANQFAWGKLTGTGPFARWGYQFRINSIRGRYRSIDNMVTEPWIAKYIADNTRIALGSDGGDFNGIMLPVWICDLYGNRLEVGDDVATSNNVGLVEFAPLMASNSKPTGTKDYSVAGDFRGIGMASSNGYVADMIAWWGSAWVDYIENTDHAVNFKMRHSKLVQAFNDVGLLKGTLSVDAIKDAVLNNETTSVEELAKNMIYASREQGTWYEKDYDFRYYQRPSEGGNYGAPAAWDYVRYLGTEDEFVTSAYVAKTFPYAVRQLDGTPVQNARSDQDVAILDGATEEVNLLHASALQARLAWTESMDMYGLAEEAVKRLFDAQAYGDPVCYMSPADAKHQDIGDGTPGDYQAWSYLRQLFRPMFNIHDMGQCGFYAIISSDDTTGMWSRFFKTLTPAARSYHTATSLYMNNMKDAIVFLGDGFFHAPMSYFSRAGLTYGQYVLGAANKSMTLTPFRPYHIEPDASYDPGYLSGLEKQTDPMFGWNMGTYSDVANGAAFSGYSPYGVTTFKELEFRARLRYFWYLGKITLTSLFGAAPCGFNCYAQAISKLTITQYHDELMRRFDKLNFNFTTPVATNIPAKGSLPDVGATHIQATKKPFKTGSRSFAEHDFKGSRSGNPGGGRSGRGPKRPISKPSFNTPEVIPESDEGIKMPTPDESVPLKAFDAKKKDISTKA